MSKKNIKVSIFNHDFTVKTDNDQAFVEEVAKYVNEKLDLVKGQTKSASSINVALLACLNIADEYLKFKQERGRMKGKAEKKIQGLIELIEAQL